MWSHGPGFRFHPTDEELTVYYLKRQVMGRKFHRGGTRVLDVYNFDPWDLPGKDRRKRDLKQYFFCPRERKYLTGERIKRATKHGFWKTTGRDRPVHCNGEIVGMIKSLIFHHGNLKQRTDWVMHEYKLLDEYLKQPGLEKDVFVLCVIFKKEGPGPRNGAQYGAPYRDEDWDDDNDCDCDCDCDTDDKDTNVVATLAQVDMGPSTMDLPSDINQPGNQEIGNGWDITGEPSIPPYEDIIFDGLENICRVDDFGVDAYLPQHDYMEMDDFGDFPGPVEGSHDHGHIVPGEHMPYFDPMIPEGVPVATLVGQQNLSVGISDGMLSCNGHCQDPAERKSPISYKKRKRKRPINDPQTGLRFDDLRGSGEYRPFWQHSQISDGVVVQGFGNNIPTLNHNHQFAQAPAGFVGQSLRENVTSLHGPQFSEDSVGFGVHSFEENASHINQHGQTADGSIGFHCQEVSMNGQMDHHFDSAGTAASFGMQLQ